MTHLCLSGPCSLSGDTLNLICKTALALMFSEMTGHSVDEEEVIRPGAQPGPPRRATCRPHRTAACFGKRGAGSPRGAEKGQVTRVHQQAAPAAPPLGSQWQVAAVTEAVWEVWRPGRAGLGCDEWGQSPKQGVPAARAAVRSAAKGVPPVSVRLFVVLYPRSLSCLENLSVK